MDLSVLPNNNHPDKFLQLEVKSLVKRSTFLPANWTKFPEAPLPGVQQWHNRIYLQVDGLETKREKRTVTELPGLDLNMVSQETIDKSLGKHITPVTLKSTIKSNPLYSDIHVDDDWEEKKKTPSWTVQDYDRQPLHSNLASHIKENPNDLQFWMGDIYTPGITEYAELEGAHQDHQLPLLVLHRTSQESHHVPKATVQMLHDHCDQFPGESAPVPDHSLDVKPFPSIQPKPPLTQLHSISLSPVTGHKSEGIGARSSVSLCVDIEDLSEVSPQSPPG
ncbi:hypothetical protein DUI87_32798 [Hirundo rustica rustica]|uniref:Major intrinsically disordered Notch2-binding receptor 1-like C-terminal domain-containing protein n=1 Tax=Hirundo rustica rustica TaxID=333673 RepID=A0A3M0IQ53_HIRRU|nr:hypothetical protein DUI87_32798 [Hirundo rustica rustica]